MNSISTLSDNNAHADCRCLQNRTRRLAKSSGFVLGRRPLGAVTAPPFYVAYRFMNSFGTLPHKNAPDDSRLHCLEQNASQAGRLVSTVAVRVRKQQVRTTTSSSVPSAVLFGVPKGPILDRSCFSFTLPTCCSSLNVIISRLMRMQTTPTFTVIVSRLTLALQVSVCIDEVSAWMNSNRLQLNPAKTEVLWCASSRRQHQIPTGPVRVGDALVSPVTAARDLDVYIDAGVTMRTQVISTVRACFADP